MKKLFLFSLIFLVHSVYAQEEGEIRVAVSDTKVTMTIIDFTKDSLKKDGYHYQQYLIHIKVSEEEVKNLEGKNIGVEGKLVIEKTNEPDKDDGGIGIRKGIWHIYEPIWHVRD